MARRTLHRFATTRRRNAPVLVGVACAGLVACGDGTATQSPPVSGAATATTPVRNGVIVAAGKRPASNDAGIYVMAADGTGVQHIQNTVDGDVTPSIAKDGKTIVFSDEKAAITVISIDGTGRKKITTEGDEATAKPGHDSPVVTPDGTKVVFLQDVYPAHTHQIWVANIDGSDAKLVQSLSDKDETAIHPSVSPDGTEVAYEDIVAPDTARGIYTVKLENGKPEKVGTLPAGADGDTRPAWSPDGQRVAFTELLGGLHSVWVMKLDGSGRQRISGPAPADDSQPSWSNDSQKITYEMGKGGVGIVNADGTNPHSVIAGDFHTPRWAPGS